LERNEIEVFEALRNCFTNK